MRYPAILAAAVAIMAIAAPAGAETAQAAVKYRDLDLTTQAGQDALAGRIDSAARLVCGLDAANTGSRLPSNGARQCYRETKASMTERIAELVSQGSARG